MLKSSRVVRGVMLVMWLAMAGAGQAANIYRVKGDATGANNGTSWANAFTGLQVALAAAQSGDEIWVAAGTYKPTSGTGRAKSFVLVAGVGVYGGFGGTETAREQRDWKAQATILSGDIGTSGTASDNSYHVVTGANLAILDGFTVTGGNYDATHGYGGGMVNNNITSLTVINCTFSGNEAGSGSGGGYGGGIFNSGGSPTITNCTFSGNTTGGTMGGGGGMCNTNSASPTVTDCTFSGNSAGSGGGGMWNSNSGSPTVTHCTFSGNYADDYGGGMCNWGGSPTVTNCTFGGNSTNKYGGGMYNSNSSSLTVTNCNFSGNYADDYGGGMYNKSGSPTVTHCTFSGNSASHYGGGMNNSNSSSTVINCILWENSATTGPEVYKSGGNPSFRYCDIRGSGGSGAQWNPALGTDGGGNIMDDPRFVDAVHPAGADGTWMTADDGLRLQVGSPCINAGDPSVPPETDILDNPRIGLPDIGAYEYQPPPPLNGVAGWAIYD